MVFVIINPRHFGAWAALKQLHLREVQLVQGAHDLRGVSSHDKVVSVGLAFTEKQKQALDWCQQVGVIVEQDEPAG